MKPSRKSKGRQRLATTMTYLLDVFTGQGRTLLVLALVLVVLGGTGHWIWQRVGPTVLARQEYQLLIENIEVSPQPDWIRTDVRAEVVRDGSLDRELSMLDETLGEQIAGAFAFHPWVDRVARVTKIYPGKVRVDLHYRRPAAAVKLLDSQSLELLVVDTCGVRLPDGNFSPTELRQFPRLINVVAMPLVGQKSRDAGVVGGAKLAALLTPVWHEMNLAEVVPVPSSNVPHPIFELVTYEATRFIWGASPSEEQEKISDQEKLARLQAYFREHGTLDVIHSQTVVDVRQLPPSTRTAQSPETSEATGKR